MSDYINNYILNSFPDIDKIKFFIREKPNFVVFNFGITLSWHHRNNAYIISSKKKTWCISQEKLSNFRKTTLRILFNYSIIKL